MAKKSLIKLAKKTTNKSNDIEKKVTNSSNINKKPENFDAKDIVNKLLDDVSTTINPIKTINNVEPTKVKDEKVNNWLENQIELLTFENEKLRKELGDSKTSEGNITKNNIIKLFREIQNAYLESKKDPKFVLYGVKFMNKMVEVFSFLGKERRY